MTTNIIGLIVGIIVMVGAILWRRKERGKSRRALNIPIGLAGIIISLAIFFIVTGG